MRTILILACLALAGCAQGLESCRHLVVDQITRQYTTRDGAGEIKRTETYCYSGTEKLGPPQEEE